MLKIINRRLQNQHIPRSGMHLDPGLWRREWQPWLYARTCVCFVWDTGCCGSTRVVLTERWNIGRYMAIMSYPSRRRWNSCCCCRSSSLIRPSSPWFAPPPPPLDSRHGRGCRGRRLRMLEELTWYFQVDGTGQPGIRSILQNYCSIIRDK